jgi:plastocyanin
MRKLIVIALVVGCLGTLASVALAATKSIKVGDNYYVRPKGVPTVTVSKGTTVKFNFRGSNPHTVTRFSGPRFKTCSSTCKRTLKRRGTYRLYCTIHGRKDQSMRLVVK